MVGVEIALDGELSSKKELGELARLQFDSVEQVCLLFCFYIADENRRRFWDASAARHACTNRYATLAARDAF